MFQCEEKNGTYICQAQQMDSERNKKDERQTV